MAKTTKNHFELFSSECEKWIAKFGMLDWEISFEHKKLDEYDIAEHAFNTYARTLILRLTTHWPEDMPLNDEQIKLSAKHEVFEGRLAPIRKLAESRFIRNDEIGTEIHAIVQLICNIL